MCARMYILSNFHLQYVSINWTNEIMRRLTKLNIVSCGAVRFEDVVKSRKREQGNPVNNIVDSLPRCPQNSFFLGKTRGAN